MKYYKVFAYSNGNPSYWIGIAESNEDAIKKSKINPILIMDVWVLDEWIEFSKKRRGNFYKDENKTD